MTNTLHRYSEHYAIEGRTDVAPVQDDYIVFAMSTRSLNDDDLVEKYRTFARLALRHHPVNVGDATKGGVYRPQPHLNPLAHWKRDHRPDADRLINDIDGHTTMAAVFSTFEAMEAFVRDLREADLGVSINISAPMDAARRCCQEVGIKRHSVEYSLGFQGRVERLPDRAVLEIGTMCGHGMVSHHLVKKLLDWIKEGRRTPREATRYLARFCICGVFNTARAEKLFENARTGAP
ncbi:MAG: hypothetical protein HY725_03725 [Candidatus Rokubacteria bacterium]|nr:hypothetical protein [Candidatus Rokubacteria bacterium]